jgi:hypothetical protein
VLPAAKIAPLVGEDSSTRILGPSLVCATAQAVSINEVSMIEDSKTEAGKTITGGIRLV